MIKTASASIFSVKQSMDKFSLTVSPWKQGLNDISKRHIPESLKIQQHRCEKLKYRKNAEYLTDAGWYI